ncbi:MAG: carboxynorspermidine decarboxylase [Lachnospiraceae bacterium]
MNRNNLQTPVYLVQEKKLEENLKILASVMEQTECKILLAQKAFSMYSYYPLIGKYLAGVASSGLYEARLGVEEMGKEGHVFSPAFTTGEMEYVTKHCSHIIFNSIRQLEMHRNIWEPSNASVGLRINPEHSTQDTPLYDPCGPYSRLGVRKEEIGERFPEGVEGIHMHTLCEQGFQPLQETFRALEHQFGAMLYSLKWINLGGGHHITKEGYDVEGLISFVKEIKEKYKVEVYLEPGEAIALNAGSLITTVMDIVDNGMPILILDASAACHMPDVIEMPYRPPLLHSGMPGEKQYTVRLSSRTCLAGDVIGEYSFDEMPKIGDRLEFLDMAIYTMVKNNTFNGMPLPSIAKEKKDGTCCVVKEFGYEEFKRRL